MAELTDWKSKGVVGESQWRLKLKDAKDTEYCVRGRYGLLRNNCATLTEMLLKGVVSCPTICGVWTPVRCNGEVKADLATRVGGDIISKVKQAQPARDEYWRKVAAACVDQALQHVAGGSFSEDTEVIVWDWGLEASQMSHADAGRHLLGLLNEGTRQGRKDSMMQVCDRASVTLAGGHISIALKNPGEPWVSIGVRTNAKSETLIQSPDPTPNPFTWGSFTQFRVAAWTFLQEENARTLNKLLDPNRSGAFEHKFWIKPCLPKEEMRLVSAYVKSVCPEGAECSARESDGHCEILIRTFKNNTFRAVREPGECMGLAKDECARKPQCFTRASPMGAICAAKPGSFNELLDAIYNQVVVFLRTPESKQYQAVAEQRKGGRVSGLLRRAKGVMKSRLK